MTERDFCFWLTGYTELGGAAPTPEQWEVIKEHLDLVFTKVTTKSVVVPQPAALAVGSPFQPGGMRLCATAPAASPAIPPAAAKEPTYCVSKTLAAMQAKEEKTDHYSMTGFDIGKLIMTTC